MSLENLINIAITELKVEKSFVISHLKSFIEKYGTKEFNDSGDFPYFNQFLKIFNGCELLNIDFKYFCNDFMDSATAYTFDEECEYCGNKINVNTSEHQHKITIMYSFKKRLIHDIYRELDIMDKENILKNYLIEGYNVNLEELISLKDRVVPFIGSGVSIPFNLPSWGGMLMDLKNHLQENRWSFYEELIEDGDYLEALSLLKKSSFSLDTDQRIQEKIQELFEAKLNLNIEANQHNYYDLLKMDSNFYLTTNYDHIFTTLRSKEKFVSPLTWDEIDNLQRFLITNKGSMIHLHGEIHRPTSMIVTQDNYDLLYQNTDFERTLTNFMSNRVLLFIGFSFDDKFFQKLFGDIINKIGGQHYLLAPNISREQAREFSQKGLKVIGLNIKTEAGKLDKNDVILGLRSVLEKFHEN